MSSLSYHHYTTRQGVLQGAPGCGGDFASGCGDCEAVEIGEARGSCAFSCGQLFNAEEKRFQVHPAERDGVAGVLEALETGGVDDESARQMGGEILARAST